MSEEIDYTWLVEAAGRDMRKLAELAVLFASAAIAEASIRADGFTQRIQHFRQMIDRIDRVRAAMPH